MIAALVTSSTDDSPSTAANNRAIAGFRSSRVTTPFATSTAVNARSACKAAKAWTEVGSGSFIESSMEGGDRHGGTARPAPQSRRTRYSRTRAGFGFAQRFHRRTVTGVGRAVACNVAAVLESAFARGAGFGGQVGGRA